MQNTEVEHIHDGRRTDFHCLGLELEDEKPAVCIRTCCCQDHVGRTDRMTDESYRAKGQRNGKYRRLYGAIFNTKRPYLDFSFFSHVMCLFFPPVTFPHHHLTHTRYRLDNSRLLPSTPDNKASIHIVSLRATCIWKYCDK